MCRTLSLARRLQFPFSIEFRQPANYECFRCTQIKTYSWENAQVVLVGNKCDMDGERVVSLERGRQLADQLGTATPLLTNTLVRTWRRYMYLRLLSKEHFVERATIPEVNSYSDGAYVGSRAFLFRFIFTTTDYLSVVRNAFGIFNNSILRRTCLQLPEGCGSQSY